jgi:serine/threonine protein kinase
MCSCFNDYESDCHGIFLQGMVFLYKNNSIHCDLSPDNVLLHREGDNLYIGVCDWGFACRIDFPHQSHYLYQSQKEIETDIMRQPWVDPSLMSLHGSEVAKFSLATDMYATSKLALWIIGSFAPETGISSVDYTQYTTGLKSLLTEAAEQTL